MNFISISNLIAVLKLSPGVMSFSAIHAVAHGRVQGVGFRYFIRNIATSYGLKGWVRNLQDGTVEMYVEGEKEVLENFIKEAQKGPNSGYVSELTTEWTTPENKFNSFNISF